MNEFIIVIILAALGIVALISYLIFMELQKKFRLDKSNHNKREIIRAEKELDRNDAIKRRLSLVLLEKSGIVKKSTVKHNESLFG